jgi:hypothetical protein
MKPRYNFRTMNARLFNSLHNPAAPCAGLAFVIFHITTMTKKG